MYAIQISYHEISKLTFDFSRSLKVKLNSAIGFPIYRFIISNNNNISFRTLSTIELYIIYTALYIIYTA